MPSRRLIVTLLVLVFLSIQLGIPQITVQNGDSNDGIGLDLDSSNAPDDVTSYRLNVNARPAADPVSGVLDSVVVEQNGYLSTGMLGTRTDSGINVQSSIPIDNSTGWMGSEARIDLYNMKRQFAENGLFDDGIGGTTYYPNTINTYPYGWDCIWYDPSYGGAPGEQNVSVSYDDTEEYVVLQTIGEFDDSSGYVEYRHYDGTYIYWNQTIENAPSSDNLTLSFMYNYESGVIDKVPYELAAAVWLDVWVDGVNVDYIDLLTECDSRGTWYEFITPNLTSLPARFNLEIGIYIQTAGPEYYLTNPGGDYDEDESLDFDNTRINRVLLDNVTLLGEEQPSYNDVNLTFHAGTFSAPVIEGDSSGSVIISNPSYWTDSSLDVGISSSANISCDYEVTLLSHNYGESTSTTQSTQVGVAYTVSPSMSTSLSMYTYVGSEGVSIYENFTVFVYLPVDWENATIYDPFLNDVTSQCTFSTGLLEISTAILDRLGWWLITLESPNYAKSVSVQIYDTGTWTTGSLFRPSNLTRTRVELGTAIETPGSGSSVSFDWAMPNGTIWSTDSVSSIISGIADSSSLTFGGMNTSAGLWEVQVFWNNGTEIAYGVDTFDLYHQASASVQYPTIETDYGNVIANQIVLTDLDSGEYLLDDSVSMTANWSSTTVDFSPNFAKNWWQADFDTALLENGMFTVVVDITRPYFDPISVQFVVISTFETSLIITDPGPGTKEHELFDPLTVQLSYELWNGTGIEGAAPTITYSGPQNGIEWVSFIDIGDGLYSLDIISNISTTYRITITFSKPFHYNATDSFMLLINEIGTELTLVNGTEDVVQYGDSYRLVVEYTNSTDYGLIGANLQVVTITPSSGLTNGSFTHITDGFYEVTFTPSATGTYTIILSAELLNHETQYVTFTLTGVDIPTVLTALPSSVSISVNETFVLQLNFEDESSNPIDTGTIELIDLPTGISVSSATWIGNGVYNITIRSSTINLYNLLFRATAPNYQSSIVGFSVSVTVLTAELVAINGTADVVQYGDSYRLVVEFRNSTGYGLTGANLQVASITPSIGLTYGSFTHISGGFYEITFTPSETGTYAIVLSAELLNYETQYTTFTLTGVVIPTVLTSLPSSVSITVNETFIVQLLFEDDDLNPINGATIELLDLPSGISVSVATPVGSGLYNITIRSSEIGIYNLLFRASATNYQSAIVGFTVSVTALPTILDITNAGTIPVENGLNEVFTVQLSYELLNGTGVPDALHTFIFSGPAEGLIWYNFVDSDNGLYSIDIICNVSATYGITITMSKPYYYNTTDSFTLIIGETGTSLASLNGTADVVLFGGNFTVVLEYLNSTSEGLPGATLLVEAVTPSTGLTVTAFTPLGNGLYSITLTPDEAGTFSVVMSASLLNHETQYVTFTITATGIPTLLTTLPSSETIAIDQSFTVQIRFQDESGPSISYEYITVVNPPIGLLISAVLPLDDGYYNITLTPSEMGSFDIVFRGEAANYQSSSAVFSLIVTEIPTHLVFDGDVSATIVEFQESYELTVYYYRSDLPSPTNVDGANITVLVHDSGLVTSVIEYLGYYVITIRGEATGTWSLTITANKTNHHLATKQFLFEAEEIDTSIEGSNPLESLLIRRCYEFTFSYIIESNSSNIRSANIIPTGGAADWITFVELGNGQYMVNLTPQELGNYSVVLSFERVGFETVSFRLSFHVDPVPISVEVQGLVGAESSLTTVIVRAFEYDTETPVGGIRIFCFIINPNGASISSVALEETATTGEYSGQFVMPVAEGEYQIQIVCEAADYILSTDFIADLHPTRDIATMLWITTTRFYPIMIGLFALCIGLVYRRRARKNRIRENKATLAIKHRFDDIRSLMGVIVLHKDSGLPIYSKILRDGLEETVISAFITAITSFRGEFDIESSSEEWGLIPISDIVRVISTNKLVCAFITTGNPSPEQRERMIQFAKTVGFIFDDTMEDVPIVVLDHHTTLQFDSLFEDLLDGQLLRTYKLDDDKKFPTTSCANERIARKTGEEFKLEELATEIASCGLEEGRVYKAIMDALENHFLVTTEDSPFSTELLRAPDTVEEEG